MKKEKIFKLNSASDFKKAESFKTKLENQGYVVETKTHGLSDVKIIGKKR